MLEYRRSKLLREWNDINETFFRERNKHRGTK